MKLLAVSGGSDSMLLLHNYRKQKIVVAHVNYHFRPTSDRDEKIVREYCQKYAIPFQVLSLDEEPVGNLEAWAREKRYTFFKQIYDQYNCSLLLTAHHKDDFLETAIMQQRSNRTPWFFGIKKSNYLYGMKVRRPFINLYWKYEILDSLSEDGIIFGLDETNEDITFVRNKIRKELEGWTLKTKKEHLSWFKMSNKILEKKFSKVSFWLKRWEKYNFSIREFRSFPHFKNEIIYEWIYSAALSGEETINLSTGKIESIISFIEGVDSNKTYILSNKWGILKKEGIVKLVTL